MADSYQPSVCLKLQVIQFHGRRSAEQRDRHPDLALVRDHLFHRSREIRERTLDDLDHLPDEERDLLHRLFFRHRLRDSQQAVHFFAAQGHRLLAGADELDHALNPVDDVAGLLIQRHLDQHVPGIDLPLDRFLLAVLDLHHVLRGDHRELDRLLLVGPRIVLDPALDEGADLVLVSGRGLHGVPAAVRHQKTLATSVTSTYWRIVSIQPMTRPRTSVNAMIATVAFRSSIHDGQVTRLVSLCTSRRKVMIRDTKPGRPPSGEVTTSPGTATSIPCGPAACCTAGSTSSTPRARGASAGSSW